MRPAEDVNKLPVEQQLNVALETINAFSGWVINADTKIATLSTAQVLLALFMAAQPLSLKLSADSPLRKMALVALLIFAISFLAAVRHLGAALRPHLYAGPDLNHFVFPSVARVKADSLGRVPMNLLVHQAWTQAHALSVIAVIRYRHFSKALAWTGLNVLSVLIWLAVG